MKNTICLALAFVIVASTACNRQEISKPTQLAKVVASQKSWEQRDTSRKFKEY
jgi:hypothetical protein